MSCMVFAKVLKLFLNHFADIKIPTSTYDKYLLLEIAV